MHKPVTLSEVPGYTWADGGEAWTLLENEDLSIKRERMQPGTVESRHYHNRAQQFFYILDGIARFDIAGQRVVVAGGEGLHIPPGTPHSIQNRGERVLLFLVISQPNIGSDRTNLDHE